MKRRLLFPILLSVLMTSGRADDAPSKTLHEGLETATKSWRREETDATVKIVTQERSNRAAHEGKMSERFVFTAGPGSVLFYSLNVPRFLVDDQVRASLYARSNRPGLQIFARVTIPADIDPDTGRPSFVLVPGTSTVTPDRWDKVEIKDLATSLEREARILRAGTKRKVDLAGAYVERVVVNLYGGAGDTEVFLDDLTIDSYSEPRAAEAKEEAAEDVVPEKMAPVNTRRSGRVQLVANQLLKDGADWVPIVADVPGADPVRLRQAGFDAIVLPPDADEKTVQEAIKAGLLLIPSLPVDKNSDPAAVVAMASAYPHREQVAFWNLGDHLATARDLKSRKDELENVRSVVSALRELNDGTPRLTLGTAEMFIPQYSLSGRNLDMLGIEMNDWATVREPLQSATYLKQRRDLAVPNNPHMPMIAWIPTNASPHVSRNVWGEEEPPSWGRPQMQHEQIRMYAYEALAAGYRAIGFRGSAELTSKAGESRLLEIALLNAEIKLVESLLARGPDTINVVPALPPDPEIPLIFNPVGGTSMSSIGKSQVKKTVETLPHETIRVSSLLSTEKERRTGRLLLVVDEFTRGQSVIGQSAINNLKLLVQAPESVQAIEITPAGTRVLDRRRTTGGLEFTLPVFSVAAMVLVTSDLSVKARLDAEIAKMAPQAVEFAIRQGQNDLVETTEVHQAIVRYGHTIRDADDVLQQVATLLKAAADARDRMDYPLAWAEAKRAGFAMRYLKWWHMVRGLIQHVKYVQKVGKEQVPKRPPLSFVIVQVPPLLSWQTTPQFWQWEDRIEGLDGPFGQNLLPSGTFNNLTADQLAAEGWRNVSYEFEGLTNRMDLLKGYGFHGPKDTAMRMYVGPSDPKAPEELWPSIEREAVAVQTPPVPMKEGEFFRISVLVKRPQLQAKAIGGVIIRDSIGGEPTQIRFFDAGTIWREILIFRRAPSDGELTVTLGLAGYGEAFFEDLRIQRLNDPVGDDDPPSDILPPPVIDPIARRTPPGTRSDTTPRLNPTVPRARP